MPDFSTTAPPQDVTNPKGTGPTPFPRHMHRFASADESGAFVVAWKGKEPIYNVFRSVSDELAQAKAIEDGFSDQPVLAPKGKK